MPGNHPPTWSRLPAGLLLAIALFTAVVTARLICEGDEHLKEAKRLLEQGDRRAAVAALEDAAKAYLPGSRYTRQSLRELSILAKSAEMRGDKKSAIQIWEAKRRAVLATRHFVQPNRADLEEAEKAILRLRETESPEDGGPNPVERPRDPSPLLSLILFLGLLAWISGAGLLCVLPLPEGNGKGRRPRLFAWIACVAGLAIWLLALLTC